MNCITLILCFLCTPLVNFTHLLLVVFQERVSAKNPPEFYLTKLRVYLDPTASRSSKVTPPSPRLLPLELTHICDPLTSGGNG